MLTTGINQEFFAETVDKLMELELITESTVTDVGNKLATAVLACENIEITVLTSIKQIRKFIIDNKEDIYNILGLTFAFLELVIK